MDQHVLKCEICGVPANGAGPLERLRRNRAHKQRLDEALHEAVWAARAAGHSWEEVAAALGTSRQAAWQRWRRPSSKRPASEMSPRGEDR